MNNLLPDNPRAVTGDNAPPDYAREVTERMARDYAETVRTVTELLDDARRLPKEVADDDTVGVIGAVIKRMRDVKERLEAFREKEKEPYYRGGQGVDQFFFGLEEKLEKRKATDSAGAVDVLQARVHAYNQRKLAEQRRIREEQERAAREAEDKARRERQEQERLQREAEEKAARARKDETAEAQRRLAAVAEHAAATARAAEEEARRQVDEARLQAAAKPSDMVRTRHDGGVLNTMRQVPHVEIVNEMDLDPVALWPFVKSSHKLQALKEWAKATQHRQQMKGAVIEMRDDTVIL